MSGRSYAARSPGRCGWRHLTRWSSATTSADVDAVAAGAVIDLLREMDLLLESLSAAPISELRSGGLGVREVRRLAKVTGVDEARLGLILSWPPPPA